MFVLLLSTFLSSAYGFKTHETFENFRTSTQGKAAMIADYTTLSASLLQEKSVSVLIDATDCAKHTAEVVTPVARDYVVLSADFFKEKAISATIDAAEFVRKATPVVTKALKTGASTAYQFTTNYALPAAKKGGEYGWKFAQFMAPIAQITATCSAYVGLTAFEYTGIGVHKGCEYFYGYMPTPKERENYSATRLSAFYAANATLQIVNAIGCCTEEGASWLKGKLPPLKKAEL